jgi:hypothetical protein
MKRDGSDLQPAVRGQAKQHHIPREVTQRLSELAVEPADVHRFRALAR